MQKPRSVKMEEREEVLWSRDSPAARGGPHGGAGGWAQKRPRFCGKAHAGAVYGGLQCVEKDLSWRNSWRADPHERDPMLEQGKSVRSPPPEEEGEVETMWDELTATPIPAPCAAGGEEAEVSGAKLSPGRKEGRGEGVFLRYGSISHHPTPIWLLTN